MNCHSESRPQVTSAEPPNMFFQLAVIHRENHTRREVELCPCFVQCASMLPAVEIANSGQQLWFLTHLVCVLSGRTTGGLIITENSHVRAASHCFVTVSFYYFSVVFICPVNSSPSCSLFAPAASHLMATCLWSKCIVQWLSSSFCVLLFLSS